MLDINNVNTITMYFKILNKHRKLILYLIHFLLFLLDVENSFI